MPSLLAVAATLLLTSGIDPTKHVLWATHRPRPSTEYYANWYKQGPVEWVSQVELPRVPDDAKVDLFFLTKPVMGVFGRLTRVWHSGLGFRVRGGPAFVYQYTSLDEIGAASYPDVAHTDIAGYLHWPATAVVDYLVSNDTAVFPAVGANWAEEKAIGEMTGEALNDFASWSLVYAEAHPRYLGWRLLESGTEKPLLESHECFDFVFSGLRHLNRTSTVNATQLPRTIINLYATSLETLAFNASVSQLFSSRARATIEMMHLTHLVKLPEREREWYWPAWYSGLAAAGGNGSLLQDSEFPRTYHRYNLAWPRHFTSEATKPGLRHTTFPISDVDSAEYLHKVPHYV